MSSRKTFRAKKTIKSRLSLDYLTSPSSMTSSLSAVTKRTRAQHTPSPTNPMPKHATKVKRRIPNPKLNLSPSPRLLRRQKTPSQRPTLNNPRFLSAIPKTLRRIKKLRIRKTKLPVLFFQMKNYDSTNIFSATNMFRFFCRQ